MRLLDDKGKSNVWWFDKFRTNASFVEVEDCGSVGIDDSEELAIAGAVCFFKPSLITFTSPQ